MKEFDKELQVKLESYVQEGPEQKISASGLAEAAGINKTYLSNYRNSKLPCNIEDVEMKLKEYFRNMEEASRIHKVGEYVETSVSKSVYQTIRLCHLQGGLAVEAGDAGIGKTMAAKKYTEDYSSALYICVNVCTNSVAAILKEFARVLHIPANGRKDDLWVRINEVLKSGKRVLIVDESQHLPIKSVELLRAFTDQNPNLGICFIGNHQSIFNNGLPEYAQITSRTKIRRDRHASDIQLDDIKLLFPNMDEKSIKFLYQFSQTNQGLRGTLNVYQTALNGKNMSYEGLVTAAKTTNSERGINK